MEVLRLQVYLARCGLGSRRSCEELIRQGLVEVDGELATLGEKVRVGEQKVFYRGRLVRPEEEIVAFLLHKPRGYLTTVKDPYGRPTVMGLLPQNRYRLFPVGRLDFDTSGLLFFTNYGPLSNRLLHPAKGVEKRYLAKVKGRPSEEKLERLRRGVEIEGGTTAPCKVWLESDGRVGLVLKEGRKRQVRLMLAEVGHPVMELVRTHFGPWSLEGIKLGRFRQLSQDELNPFLEQGSASTKRGKRK